MIVAMIAGNVWNFLSDLVLVFGWGPIPPLGVAGAAISTLCMAATGTFGSGITNPDCFERTPVIVCHDSPSKVASSCGYNPSRICCNPNGKKTSTNIAKLAPRYQVATVFNLPNGATFTKATAINALTNNHANSCSS